MRGNDPFVERVREATDILELVSGYVELKRAGSRWKGLCPFHREKTPSFHVSQENQSYYCFGCAHGGDVFSFVMELEKLTFPEALRMLADRAGIEMPKHRSARGPEVEDRLAEALDVAAAFFRKRLASPEGAEARSYLAARGIGASTIDRFGIGWAPASWDALLRHAGRLLPERILLQAGLVVEGERGIYDRFRERVMIPIRTPGGRPIAFGGRLIGAGEPKYLNSPETPLYRKGTILYGLREARDGIRREGDALVVEGYFDLISLAEAGIDWVVGTCGTAFTQEQASLLRRYSERWTLLFDGDAAGRAAVLRALETALPVHPGVRVALCPAGIDPDAWVRRDGAEAVREAMGQAYTPLQFVEEHGRSEGWSIEEMLRFVARLLDRILDPMVQDRWVQEAAGRFRIHEQAIWNALGHERPKHSPPGRKPAGETLTPRFEARERQIMAAAVRSPAAAALLRDASSGAPGVGDRCRAILAWIADRSAEGVVDAAALLSRAADEGPQLVRDLSFLYEEEVAVAVDPEDLASRLRVLRIRKEMQELTDRIRRAEERGDETGALLLEKEILARRLRDDD